MQHAAIRRAYRCILVMLVLLVARLQLLLLYYSPIIVYGNRERENTLFRHSGA